MTTEVNVCKSSVFRLRFGEMERDAMIAHGAANFLRERLFDCSDKFQIPTCDLCGCIANKVDECNVCKTDQVSMTNIPYSAKLLLNEMAAMGIKISIQTK